MGSLEFGCTTKGSNRIYKLIRDAETPARDSPAGLLTREVAAVNPSWLWEGLSIGQENWPESYTLVLQIDAAYSYLELLSGES